MVRDGFAVGDVVFINKNDKNIAIGDIVAFYYPGRNLAETPQNNFVAVKDFKIDGEVIIYTDKTSNAQETIVRNDDFDDEKVKDVKQKNRIYFHYVVGIYIDPATGQIYYKTCGAGKDGSNTFELEEEGLVFGQAPESYYTREDLIVGKYKNTPQFMRKVMVFMGSSLGMIILVCLPICILIITESLSLIDQVSIIMIEKRIMKGEVKLDDKDLKKSYNPNTMEPINKILYYFNAPQDSKEFIANTIWSEMFVSESEKDIENSAHIKKAIEILNSGDNVGYFEEMKETLSKRDQKKLDKETSTLLMLSMFKNVKI